MESNSCRICLQTVTDGYGIAENVCNKPIWLFMSKIADVHIDLNDNLPQEVCSDCFTDLQNAAILENKILNADKKLRLQSFPFVEVKIEAPEENEEPLNVGWIIDQSPEIIEQPPPKPPKSKPSKPRTKVKKYKNGIPVCCMCGALCPNNAELKKHCNTLHPGGAPENKVLTTKHTHQCEYCKRKFRLMRFVKQHFLNRDFVEPPRDRTKETPNLQLRRRVCSICGQELSDKQRLEMHIAAKHGGTRDFVCTVEECKKSFVHKNLLKKHMKISHGKKEFVCDYCSKEFHYMRKLREHMFVHIKEKPHQCDKCDKTFTLGHMLKAHILAMHSGIDYPFICDFCPNAYKYKCDLQKHRQAYHFGKFPAVCKFCGKGYTSSSSRNYHQQRCPLGKNFDESDALVVGVKVAKK